MRETKNVEFKSQISKTYLKTVSAFANYGSGHIVFGVADDGEVVGLKDPNGDALRIENAINDSLRPVPVFSLDIDNTAKTITLNVEQGCMKPYLYNGKAYKRADTSTIEVGELELKRLMLLGLNLTFDALDFGNEHLKFVQLASELKQKVGLEKCDNNILKSLELMSADGVYNNAGALLSDENNFAGVDIARFGESVNVILSRKTFEKMSVLRQMHLTIEMFNDNYLYEEIVGEHRIQKFKIPYEAFRETLANALVHRCWDVAANIKVSMFADCIEVSSPGGLPEGITKDEYLNGGLALARNPILANVFFRLGYIERFGTGIPRIIYEYEQFTVSPIFEIRESSLCVTLPVVESVSLTNDEKAVLAAFPKGEIMTRAQIADATGTSKDKAIRLLNALISKHFIEQIGSGRSQRYKRL
jgi:ATP-dependent DNA helicase RecG